MDTNIQQLRRLMAAATRARKKRILAALAKGKKPKEIAQTEGVSRQWVEQVRNASKSGNTSNGGNAP